MEMLLDTLLFEKVQRELVNEDGVEIAILEYC